MIISKVQYVYRGEEEANPWPKRLYALRRHYDLTQAEAAERISAPTKTWENWEQGRRRPNPMIVRLIELAFPEYFAKS